MLFQLSPLVPILRELMKVMPAPSRRTPMAPLARASSWNSSTEFTASTTSLGSSSSNTGPPPQPAVAFDVSGSEAILGVGPDFLKISSIDSPATVPTLNTQDRTLIVPDGLQNFGATQKGSAIPINTGNLIFSSSV